MKNTRALEDKRIKETYHCAVIGDNRPFRVQVQDGLYPGVWGIRKWFFSTEQDAVEYCKHETKNFPARVIFEKYVAEENTIYELLVYTKEV